MNNDEAPPDENDDSVALTDNQAAALVAAYDLLRQIAERDRDQGWSSDSRK